ncbi:MAG: DUF1731 domain-containing protein [Akkermansiaceae bacterium]
MRIFRKVAERSMGLPAAKWMLEIGAFFLRTETEMVTKSRWVVPSRLEKEGLRFHRPDFKDALEDLRKRARLQSLKPVTKGSPNPTAR